MPPNRGTDLATEQRQLRPREENDAIGTWLEDLFDAGTEVLFCSIPVLGLLMLSGDVELTFVATVAIAALVLAVGAKRNGRWGGPPWPKTTPLLALARVPLYNVALLVGIRLGRALFSTPVVDFEWVREPIVGPSVVAAASGLVAVAAFPYLAVAVQRVR